MSGPYRNEHIGSDSLTSADFKRIFHLMLPGLCVAFPAFASSYFLLSFVWDLPDAKNIIGVVAIITFAMTMYLSTAPVRYDGQIVIRTEETGKRVFSLELNKDPDEIENMGAVLFKVREEEPPELAD